MKLDPKTRDCRRSLVRLYNLALTDKISASKAAKLAYVVGIILKSVENEEAKWASSESQPSPAMIAQQIREAMRAADAQVPGPEDGA